MQALLGQVEKFGEDYKESMNCVNLFLIYQPEILIKMANGREPGTSYEVGRLKMQLDKCLIAYEAL